MFERNVIATLADHLSEAMAAAAETATGLRGETAAALITLLNEPGISIRRLTDVLGIRPPSGVQLLRRLRSMSLAALTDGPDRRTRAVTLTPAGEETARRMLAAREQAVSDLLSQITATHRASLARAAAAALATASTDRATADHLCRRCDEPACPDERCPVETGLAKARDSHGKSTGDGESPSPRT